jgi:hypothetical protein
VKVGKDTNKRIKEERERGGGVDKRVKKKDLLRTKEETHAMRGGGGHNADARKQMLKGQRGLERWEGGGGERKRNRKRGRRRKGSKIRRGKNCERKGGGGEKDTKAHTKYIFLFLF